MPPDWAGSSHYFGGPPAVRAVPTGERTALLCAACCPAARRLLWRWTGPGRFLCVPEKLRIISVISALRGRHGIIGSGKTMGVTRKRMQIADEAIVIRERSAGEDDKLLTLLCRREGVITAYARGAKKVKSAVGPSCGLLAYSSFQLFHSRDRYIIDRADTINLFFGLRQDIEKLSLASYLAEAACTAVPTGRESELFLRLMLNCLHFLEKDICPPRQVKAVFELRSLAMSGFMPDLVACSGCGCYEAEKMFFFPLEGTLRCINCAGDVQQEGLPLPAGVLAAMRHIVYSQFEKLFSFRLSEAGLSCLEQVCERYFLIQMGRDFQTLTFYHSLSDMAAWTAPGLPERGAGTSVKGGE